MKRSGLLGAAATVVMLALAAPAAAQTFTVTNLGDASTATAGDGSLRGEMRAANAHEGADTIAFAPGLSGTINLVSSGLVISGPLAIEGPGPQALTVRQTAGGHRVFQLALTEEGPVSIAGLTIGGGETPGSGGDIEYEPLSEPSALTITNCVVTEGSAEEFGGAISTGGIPLTIRSSMIAESEAEDGGGIIAGGFHGPVTIEDSTIADNEASVEQGGGLLLQSETGSHDLIVDSTIVGNSSAQDGGGLFMRLRPGTTVTVANSTVTENKAGRGGGLEFVDESGGAGVTVEDTTIAANFGGTAFPNDAGGLVSFDNTIPEHLTDTIVADSLGGAVDMFGRWASSFSLVEVPGPAELSEAIAGSNIIGVDPRLAPLAANGGPTETMALPPGSPAVNKGGGALAIDQRGGPRPVIYPGVPLSSAPGADGADIGAYELSSPPGTGGPPPPPVAPAPPPPASPTKLSPRVRVSCPRAAKPGGCRIALQVVSSKPRRAGGKGHRPKPPSVESAVARIKLGPGKSAVLTLAPKPSFAARLDAAKSLLVREVVTAKSLTHTTYRTLKVLG